MTDFLLNLLGIDVGANARVVDVELMLRAGGGAVFAAIVGVVLAGVASVWMYRREVTEVSTARRLVMASLRVGFVAMLLLMLLRPGVRATVEGDVRRQVILLLDASQSMSIRDARVTDDDRKRLGIATGMLDPARGLQQEIPATVRLEDLPRADLVRAALGDGELVRRLSGDFDVRVLTFGREVRDAVGPTTLPVGGGGVATLEAREPVTAVGDALREVLSRTRGQPTAGVVLVTDGASNAGTSPVSAAQAAGAAGVPVFAWGVGITSPRDLAVTQVLAPEVAFVDDEVVAAVRLRTTGFEGQTVTVRARLKPDTGDDIVMSQDLPVGPDGEVTVPARLTPKTPGEYTLTAEAPVMPGEVARDNNTASVKLRVVDGKIKVLVAEGQPRWEFKYLQALLLRDRRVEPKFWLAEASPTVADAPGSPYLARFPATREELFEFDLVVLGDFDPRLLTGEQLKWVEEHVTRFGAGLVTMAGRRAMPQLWAGTPVEKLIPVEWEPPTAAQARSEQQSGEAVRLSLTPAGRLSPMLRLAESEVESATAWANLPEIYWAARVTRTRPGAEALVVDDSAERASRFGKMPVVAVQRAGLGTSLFLGTDNLWRWRRNVGDAQHARLWGQLVQRLALPHLLGESKRTQLSADKRQYGAGETATLYARLYTPTFEPVSLPGVRGTLTGPGGKRSAVVLRSMPDQPGMYRGEAVVPAAGTWKFSVESDEATVLELEAGESRLELAETALREGLLREVARLSGGAFLREEDLHSLPELVAAKSQRVRSTAESELWASPLYFALMLLMVGAEWALRKGAMLK